MLLPKQQSEVIHNTIYFESAHDPTQGEIYSMGSNATYLIALLEQHKEMECSIKLDLPRAVCDVLLQVYVYISGHSNYT